MLLICTGRGGGDDQPWGKLWMPITTNLSYLNIKEKCNICNHSNYVVIRTGTSPATFTICKEETNGFFLSYPWRFARNLTGSHLFCFSWQLETIQRGPYVATLKRRLHSTIWITLVGWCKRFSSHAATRANKPYPYFTGCFHDLHGVIRPFFIHARNTLSNMGYFILKSSFILKRPWSRSRTNFVFFSFAVASKACGS